MAERGYGPNERYCREHFYFPGMAAPTPNYHAILVTETARDTNRGERREAAVEIARCLRLRERYLPTWRKNL